MSIGEVHTRSRITLHVLSAFTDGEAGGNPAGVVLDAENLTKAQMQAVATEAALSETAFVTPLPDGAFRLDFFTPNRRIADCGHATVAAFALLHDLGRLGPGETAKEIVDGRRKIFVAPDGAIFMEMRAPRYRKPEDWGGISLDEVLAALKLDPDMLDQRSAPILADAGGPFVTIAVRDPEDLEAIVPNQAAILDISERLDLTGIYAYALDPAPERAATTRMFAPRYGIPEESATGMAAGALGAVLHDIVGRIGPDFLIEQGRHMPQPSPSLLDVRLALTGARVTGITTGGRAVLRSARCIELQS